MSLRRKFGILIFATFTVMAVIVAGLQVHWVDKLLIRHTEAAMTQSIRAAWVILRDRQHRLETIVSHLCEAPQIVGGGQVSVGELVSFLDGERKRWAVDVLFVLDAQGRVLAPQTSPSETDALLVDPLPDTFLRRGDLSGIMTVNSGSIVRNGGEPATRAGTETTMLLFAARRIGNGPDPRYLLAGNVLDSADAVVDDIQRTVFPDEQYKGHDIGTATIFHGRERIATTVTLDNGQRAVGTIVSDEVAHRVLDRGDAWTGPALVINRWYLSRYEPIHDPAGQVIGMLYIGTLQDLYLDIKRHTLMTVIGGLTAVMLLATLITYFVVRRMLRQIAALDGATKAFTQGDLTARADIHTRDEIGALAHSFNAMANALEEDRKRILEQKDQIETINANYLTMLGFVTHELRGTLGAATFNLRLLRDGNFGAITEEHKEGIELIGSSLAYLEEITDNYLQLSRIEQGELALAASRVYVAEQVVEPVLEGLDGPIQAKKMRVTNHIAPEVNVRADANLLRVIYENLIGNAVKYGKTEGEIVLDARPGEKETTLVVRNEGKAIPPERLPHLFEKFRRYDVDESTGRRGTGLGLFIVNQIIAQHGGRISVESNPESGTQFTIVLPE